MDVIRRIEAIIEDRQELYVGSNAVFTLQDHEVWERIGPTGPTPEDELYLRGLLGRLNRMLGS